MIKFHRILLLFTAAIGSSIASLAILLMIPAMLDGSPAAFLLAVPAVLVVWAILLIQRMRSVRVVSSSLWRELACFYVITGAVSVWSSTWTFSREEITARIFDPSTTFIVAVYFLVPILQLLLTGNQSTKNTDLVPQIPRVPRFFERFTLLLVVLSCLTILSGYFLYHNFGYDATYEAKVKAKTLPSDTRYRLRTIEMGLHWYRAQYGTLPTRAQGLSALWDNPGVDHWNWIYGENEDMLVDGWNTPIEYRPGTNGFVLRSAGPDRQFNTDDDLTVTAE